MKQSFQARFKSRWRLSGSVVVLAAAVSGCQTAGGSAYAPYPVYDYSQASGPSAAGSVPVAAQPVAPVQTYNPVPYQALEASALELKERLERVEKAMLRLDRRMQLVERNELSRMGTQTSQAEPVLNGTEEQVAMRALNIGPGDSNAAIPEGFRPVSSRNESITSALQAAPGLGSSNASMSAGSSMQVATRNSLPSLADPVPTQSRSLQSSNSQMAIWTVRYEPSKVWPDRAQLPSSRDVVDALRESGATIPLTLYARGKNANGVEFRERVKALSRYLSKVSSLDSVPIAAMAAPHMDDQTIEILVTH